MLRSKIRVSGLSSGSCRSYALLAHPELRCPAYDRLETERIKPWTIRKVKIVVFFCWDGGDRSHLLVETG